MKKHKLVGVVACLVMLAGCATPAAIKEATVALDQGFKDNLKMMRQYRALVTQINERHEYWWQYTKRRALLRSALLWATTDPPSRDPDVSNEDFVGISKEILGNGLVTIVNKIRLTDLPARKDAGGVVFIRNAPTPEDQRRGTVGGIMQAFPALINAIDDRVVSGYTAIVANDLSGFDAYKTNVEALARINATIQRYLAIDVTVKPEDIDAIADAIRKLQ